MMTDEVVVDSSNEQPVVAESSQVTMQLGEVLLAARKAKSLTQQDVSNTLRLSIKQIDALETNDFSALPEPMITRGFIRNYARLLEVDAEPLLAGYRACVPDKSPNALSVKSSMHQVVSNKPSQSWAKYIIASIFVLLCLLAWLAYMNLMPKTVKSAEPAAVHEVVVLPPVPAVAVPLPELALPAAERQPEAGESASAGEANLSAADADVVKNTGEAVATPPKPTSTAVDFNTLKTSAGRAADQGAVSVTPAQASPAAVNAAKAGSTVKMDAKPVAEALVKEAVPGTKKVSLSATGRSWVSVTNKSGKVVFEKMLSAGSEESFDAPLPLNVVIGNAQATKLMFSGKAVDLDAATKNNVTHLTLE